MTEEQGSSLSLSPGLTPSWEPVIGLEVHCQLATRSKIFCGCATLPGAPPNSQTCPVCLGLPGALPVLNAEAVRLGARVALACDSQVPLRSAFARKHYFYPDLPKGYQITQLAEPLALGGKLAFDWGRERREVSLQRLHLEEDAGKLLHHPAEGISLVDLNRAGVPLLEVVTEPQLHDPQEAAACLKALHRLVTWLGACQGSLEAGNLRCDANISLRARGSLQPGTRVELKNLNSFRYLAQAIQAEVQRQTACLQAGQPVRAETRLFDPQAGLTVAMRDKEVASDYRYLLEPDLPPLTLSEGWLEAQRQSLPELPLARADRFERTGGLSREEALGLVADRGLAEAYEATLKAGGGPRASAQLLLGEVQAFLNRHGGSVAGLPALPQQLAELQALVQEGQLSLRAARELVGPLLAEGGSVRAWVEERGLSQLVDPEVLGSLVREALARNPRAVADFRAGQAKVRSFLLGQVQKACGGRAHPGRLAEVLEQVLQALDG